MDDILRQALAPVLRDITTSGAPQPDIRPLREDDWSRHPNVTSTMLWSRDGSGAGVFVDVTQPEHERIARVADQVQEWVIEELWGQRPTNWPVCPHHPDTHPLTVASVASVASVDDEAVWSCPADGTRFWAVGSLPE